MSEEETPPVAVPPAAPKLTPADVRPLVGAPASNRGAWLFGGVLVLVGVGLFSALEARRDTLVAPSITAPSDYTGAMIAPPPDLAIPADLSDQTYAAALQPPSLVPTVLPPAPAPPRVVYAEPRYPSPMQQPYGPIAGQAQPPQQASPGPSFAYQAPQRPAAIASPPARPGQTTRNDERATASKLLNPETTVPLGTVIQAVMETAFDSTRSGFARAVVARDVSSFDGSRVLIPRGSKLFGEYKADVGYGQKRASIQWHRLTRPDGSIIDVDSPAADPLGRMGLKGKVNNHFFQRFGGAILQTALDIGVQIATREAAGGNIIIGGYPYGNYGGEAAGNLRNAIPRVEDIKPTVTLKQGAGVTVFVGRDLDFTAVEQ
jgi:type IV secretion system protein VirB10